MNANDLAYIAGIIDADGCILIEKYFPRQGSYLYRKGYRSPRYTLRVDIQMGDSSTVSHIANLSNRPIHNPKCYKNQKRIKHRLCWQARKARDFLILVEPYLIGKKAQAQLGIAFQSFRDKECRKGHGTRTQEIAQKKETFYLEMRNLKQVY